MISRRIAVFSVATFLIIPFGAQAAGAAEATTTTTEKPKAPLVKVLNCTHTTVPLAKIPIKGNPGETLKVVTGFTVPSIVDGKDVEVEFQAPDEVNASEDTNIRVESGEKDDKESVELKDVAASGEQKTKSDEEIKLQGFVDVFMTLNDAGNYSGGGKVKLSSCLKESPIPDGPAPGTTLCTTIAMKVPGEEVTGARGEEVLVAKHPVPPQMQGKETNVSFTADSETPAVPDTDIKAVTKPSNPAPAKSGKSAAPPTVRIDDAVIGVGGTVQTADLMKLDDTVEIFLILGSGKYAGGGRLKFQVCTRADLAANSLVDGISNVASREEQRFEGDVRRGLNTMVFTMLGAELLLAGLGFNRIRRAVLDVHAAFRRRYEQ